MWEEKPLTSTEEEKPVLVELIAKGYEFIKKYTAEKHKRELEKLREKLEALKVEKEYAEEKRKLLEEIKKLEEELAKEKVGEVT